jgi:hypothetical protein
MYPGGNPGPPESFANTLSPWPLTYDKPTQTSAFRHLSDVGRFGAGEGIRTLDPNLGKVVLYP